MAQQPQQSQQFQQQSHNRVARPSMDDMRGQIAAMGDGTTQFVEQAARRFQDISLESYRYVQGAVEMNAGVMNRLIGCRTIGEMADVQRDYLKDAIDHAFAASRRMYGIGAEMADEMGNSANAAIQDATEEAGRQREDVSKDKDKDKDKESAAAKRQ